MTAMALPQPLPKALETVRLETSRETILAYAELTADFNPIHVDPLFAARTPFGVPIVHGTLSLCLILRSLAKTFGEQQAPADLRARFLRPVPVGATLCAGGRLTDATAARYEVFVELDDGARAVEGSLILGNGVADRPPDAPPKNNGNGNA